MIQVLEALGEMIITSLLILAMGCGSILLIGAILDIIERQKNRERKESNEK